ncbi:MAG: long-chain-fatty-acid--CoA ligase [Candidatus Heimdallarchaeaceae archaeon]
MPKKIWSYIDEIPDEVEIPNITLIEHFRKTVDTYPNRKATEFMGKFKTYTELDKDINKLATALQDLGVKKGDRVAVLMPNCPQFIISFFATLSLGAIFTAISALYTSKEIRFQLQDSEAKVIITLDLFVDKIREVKEETSLEHVIVSSIADELPTITKIAYKLLKAPKMKIKDELKYKDLLQRGINKRVQEKIDPKEDVAALQYTGGTTGVMKGAMLTHRNIIAQAFILPYWDKWLPELPKGQYKIICCLPLSHIFGLSTSFLWSISVGGLLYLIPDPRNLKHVLSTISKYGVHFMNAVPLLFQKMAEYKDVNKYDLSSLYMCISGGEALPITTAEKFEKVAKCILIEGYGLSESAPVTHVNPATFEKRKVGSIGIPIPNTLAMIVDLDTEEEITEFGKQGELWVRGPSVMKGYWNNKEASEASLRKGWLRTGDIATMDKEGYFAIVDRAKDMIIVSGYKVWPNEVEETLLSHPDINMAAVVQAKTGDKEQVKAYLVAEPGSKELSYDEIKKYCKERLAPYKVPTIIEYRKELPRTVVGKISRKDLRAETVITSAQSLPKEEIKQP